MADEKKTTQDYELLADVAMVDGTAYYRGDTVPLDPKHAKRLAEEFGTVGPVGTLEKRRKAEEQARVAHVDAEAKIAEAQAAGRAVDEPAVAPEVPAEGERRGPGRPRG